MPIADYLQIFSMVSAFILRFNRRGLTAADEGKLALPEIGRNLNGLTKCRTASDRKVSSQKQASFHHFRPPNVDENESRD